VQAANDKQQIEPMLGQLATLPTDLGRPQTLLGDNGYFSAANVAACAVAEIAPLLAPGRTPHHPSLDERFAAAPPEPEHPTPLEAMLHCLATPEGKKLYAQRKHIPEPVFGIIKSVLGIVRLTSVEQKEHRAEYAITLRQPRFSIDPPPRLGRSGASRARRDGAEG
jgi:hypothetical protein